VMSVPPQVTPLSTQLFDPHSFYSHYKQWIGWRKHYPALMNGKIEFIHHDYPKVLSYMRFTDKQRLMVIHNLDENEVTVKVMDPFVSIDPAVKVIGEHEVVLAGRGSVVLELK
jgi:glycosidase